MHYKGKMEQAGAELCKAQRCLVGFILGWNKSNFIKINFVKKKFIKINFNKLMSSFHKFDFIKIDLIKIDVNKIEVIKIVGIKIEVIKNEVTLSNPRSGRGLFQSSQSRFCFKHVEDRDWLLVLTKIHW